MGLYPRNLRVEQAHPLVEFIERITVEAFQAEFVSCIFARADPATREIIMLHCSAASARFSLLSTGCKASLDLA